MKLLIIFVLIGAAGSLTQDTTSNNPYCPKKAQKDFTNCYTKQGKINNMAIQVNHKLDSIYFKWDKLLDLIRNDTIL